MIINNALINKKLYSVTVSNGIIEKIEDNCSIADIDAKGNYLIPGMIDVHTHGCMGMDTMDANFEPMCKYYAEKGTTSFLPTTMTMDYDSLLKVTNANHNYNGAQILGFHFEGPYISTSRKGAQNEEFIKNPSLTDFAQFKDVKMITIAPELENSMNFIRSVSTHCCVSLGHTDCDYETANKAIDNGANCLTHIYNAMPPFNHRKPGPIGAAMEKKIYAQIICDGFHISRPVVLATYKMFTSDKMILISDSIRCAGLPDGKYESGGLTVNLKNNSARLNDGTIAGSCACLLDCVKTAVSFGIPFYEAIKMATETPAKLLGINKGVVAVGYDADLLIIDKDFNIKNIIIAGNIIK